MRLVPVSQRGVPIFYAAAPRQHRHRRLKKCKKRQRQHNAVLRAPSKPYLSPPPRSPSSSSVILRFSPHPSAHALHIAAPSPYLNHRASVPQHALPFALPNRYSGIGGPSRLPHCTLQTCTRGPDGYSEAIATHRLRLTLAPTQRRPSHKAIGDSQRSQAGPSKI